MENRKSEMLQEHDLNGIPTCALVNELEKRDGVDTSTLSPYTEASVKVSGPAIVLVVVD